MQNITGENLLLVKYMQNMMGENLLSVKYMQNMMGKSLFSTKYMQNMMGESLLSVKYMQNMMGESLLSVKYTSYTVIILYNSSFTGLLIYEISPSSSYLSLTALSVSAYKAPIKTVL